ncbi:hypothetical protein OG921_11925 [Aldersonia sp. NBC_00410]|uniref:hypothetical protein n=1 Tax=Aldersonia sp. NBC_00410 TaxID=2975954 RepID=UPI0022585506|nr:hypothetical protein [Aldersonia sp. NBC_00410]MCX5043874.1 hypothetical protein [Aldersonia sp. NBC_00410]
MAQPNHRDDAGYISYESFGRRFFELAVSPERVAAAFGQLAGSSFDFGPIGAGPGRLVKVSARVHVGSPTLVRDDGETISFDLSIPIRLHLLIDLSVDKQRFDVDGDVALRLTVRAAEPLRVLIDVDEPDVRDVHIDVRAETLRGSVLRALGSVDDEIKRFVARYIAKEIHKPHIEAARTIDVIDQIDRAWSAPSAPDDASGIATTSAAAAD